MSSFHYLVVGEGGEQVHDEGVGAGEDDGLGDDAHFELVEADDQVGAAVVARGDQVALVLGPDQLQTEQRVHLLGV